MVKALVVMALLSPVAAFANDGGIPYIKVDSVSTKAKNGKVVTVKGGEAYKLYEVLPKDFVYDVSRSIKITSDKRSVSIVCSAKPIDQNAEIPERDPATTECSVYIGSAFDPDKHQGDNFNWEPACKAQQD